MSCVKVYGKLIFCGGFLLKNGSKSGGNKHEHL